MGSLFRKNILRISHGYPKRQYLARIIQILQIFAGGDSDHYGDPGPAEGGLGSPRAHRWQINLAVLDERCAVVTVHDHDAQ